MCLYVDDILIFRNNIKVIKEVKNFLSNNFEMKDLGVADVILNIKLLREEENGGVTLVQSHYVEKVQRYLKGTMSYAIRFTGYLRVLEGYCDAN